MPGLCDLLRSHCEYLSRNPVWSSYQQDLVVQGEKCALYKVWSVYCTSVPCVLYKCSVCIVQDVQYVLYEVCSVYCTGCAVCIYTQRTSKSTVNEEDPNIKSNLV